MSLSLAIAIVELAILMGINYLLIWSLKDDIEEARDEIITIQCQVERIYRELLKKEHE